MDPLQWMGAVRMRVQTADKNITIIIHTTPVQQTHIKKCVCMKQIYHFNNFNIKLLFPAKMQVLYPWYLYSKKVNHLKLKCLNGFVSYKHTAFLFTRC